MTVNFDTPVITRKVREIASLNYCYGASSDLK